MAAAPTEGAQFGKVVSKIPVHRLTAAVDRLLELYREERQEREESRGVLPSRVSCAGNRALKDLGEVLPDEISPEDYIDLGETQAFNPEVMEGECAS